jgi:hypothetical protein
MKEGNTILVIRRHEAEHLRSNGVFVPMYNKTKKSRGKKYLLVETPKIISILEKYRKDIRSTK